MNLSEKVQYLSGLMDGLGIDDSTDTGKMLLAMKDILDEVCEAVDEIDSDVDDIVDFCNAMDEDLHHVEEAVFDDDHDEPPHGPHHGPHGPHDPHDHHGHCCHHHPPMGDDLPFIDDFPFDDDESGWLDDDEPDFFGDPESEDEAPEESGETETEE